MTTGGNIALKCNYNDGSDTPGFVGYEATCTAQNILSNVRTLRPWCSNGECECRQWVDEGAPGSWFPKEPCYESRIFKDWRMGTGVFHNGPRSGEVDIPRQVAKGKVALLTTVLGGERDEDRLVFGVLGGIDLVGLIDDSYYIEGKDSLSLRLPRDQWLPYRDFLKPEKRKLWGSHLYRYLDDDEVARYLTAVRPMLQSPRDRTVVDQLLEVVGGTGIVPAKNPEERITLPPVAAEILRTVELLRKYGPGGEGEEHMALKQHIHDHPELLGIVRATAPEMERRYATGDRADVAFLTAKGRVVVEIEIEGDAACRVGAFQAVKYRALEAALQGTAEPSTVAAFLVAHAIGETAKNLCAKLKIVPIEVDREAVAQRQGRGR